MRKLLIITTLIINSLYCLTQTNIKLSGTGVKAAGQMAIGSVGTAVVLTSIAISPSNPSVPYTSPITFTAQGTYSDNSFGDVTAQATWASSNMSVATNSANNFQCIARGATTVSATIGAVVGTTLLSCLSPTYTPQGTFNVNQSNSPVDIVSFTGSNGVSPFTFSSSDLPGWLSLTNNGCAGNQINCTLTGTPSTVGVYNFHVQLTDNINNTACDPPGCPIGVNVVVSSAEDNTYCGLVSNVETVIGSPSDAPANAITDCNYTAISWTSLGGSPYVINVCPKGELSNTVSVAGCFNAPQPPSTNCLVSSGIWCATIQGAVNYAYNNGPCGADIQLWPRIDDGIVTSSQNIFIEPTVTSPGNINCGPDYGQPWMYIRTRSYASLPPPGNRISPAWMGVKTFLGYPNYVQLSNFGIADGIYIPQWKCSSGNGAPQCMAISSQMNTSTIGGILSGVRIMGIAFTVPHLRDSSLDAYGNHVCSLNGAGTPQCSPGFTGATINLGCVILTNNDCDQATGVQGQPPATPTGTGSQHYILDRIVMFGCYDLSTQLCYDSNETLVQMVGGQHLSVIDSYLIGGFCIQNIGPCVDSKAISGGNPKEAINDIGIKIVNNFLSGTGENVFFGGGTASFVPESIEVRRNHLFKPLNWKADDPTAVGVIGDSFPAGNNKGSGYSGATTCTIDPPLSGTQATCTPIVVGGAIADVIINNHGNGYNLRTKGAGKTYPALPSMYFTDGGVTYATCSNQLSGTVNTNNTVDVLWASDNKFIPALVGTQITISGTNYLVASYISNTHITTSTNVPTGTELAYNSNLPVRGDCIRLLNGIPNVKNLGEFKNGTKVIWEGNIHEHTWIGQSDQSGFAYLISPKNPNGNCPSCAVTDVTFRYNFLRGSTLGMQISMAVATQGGTLATQMARISIHDNIFDNMNGVYWAAGTAKITQANATCVELGNIQNQTLADDFITYNHNICIGTVPTGYSLTSGSFLNVFQGLRNVTPSMMTNMVWTNNIGAGGIKNISNRNLGQPNCNNNSCSDHAGHGPAETALRMAWQNGFSDPVVSGAYTTGEIHSVLITNNGICTSPVTGYVLSGGGGTGGSIGFNTGTVGGVPNSLIKIWPNDVGQGYTSAPSITFTGGTCSVQPAAQVYIAGNGNLSSSTGCFDHNIMPLAAWNGELNMYPYPTSQIGSTNSCVSPGGGHNNTTPGGTGYNICNGVVGANGSGPCTWADIGFVGYVNGGGTCASTIFLDSNCAEAREQTIDLHLTNGSLGHLAGNDGLDIGPDVTKVMGNTGGIFSPYTGITISGGLAVLPQ